MDLHELKIKLAKNGGFADVKAMEDSFHIRTAGSLYGTALRVVAGWQPIEQTYQVLEDLIRDLADQQHDEEMEGTSYTY